MIRRRLHLQIYLTIIASLLAIVIVIGALFAIIRSEGEDIDDQVFALTARLSQMALPPANAPVQDQQAALERLGADFRIDINLFDQNKNRLASFGDLLEPPDEDDTESDWHRQGMGPAWVLRLPDDRWLAIHLKRDKKRRPILGILLSLLGIALAIGLASYPFVRKLTGRLERLKSGVEQVGAGDLSARVEVEGKDEIASLATSFNQSAETIERLVNSNRQLLANASHELRTPLARVRLGVEMLKQKKDAKRQAALEADIAELDQLIDEILLMSRLDTGTSPQLNEIVDVLALVAEEASRYDSCEVSGQMCEIRGNSKLLRRAIRNLIDNAFKHGKPPVNVTVDPSDTTVRIRVSDAGEGISEELKQKVFQPFFRAQGKQNISGYGLGLSLVRQIAEVHGGSVDVVDSDNVLSAMEISLPRLS